MAGMAGLGPVKSAEGEIKLQGPAFSALNKAFVQLNSDVFIGALKREINYSPTSLNT